MRMSQELARRIALQMTSKKKKELDKEQKVYEVYVTSIYVSQVPKIIKSGFKLHPEWFATTESITLNGYGFNWDHVSCGKKIIENNNGRAFVKLDKELAHEIWEMKKKLEAGFKEYNALKNELENALNGLKSFTQIQKHLPEAVKYLPKSTSMEIMVNLDTLRIKLKEAS